MGLTLVALLITLKTWRGGCHMPEMVVKVGVDVLLWHVGRPLEVIGNVVGLQLKQTKTIATVSLCLFVGQRNWDCWEHSMFPFVGTGIGNNVVVVLRVAGVGVDCRLGVDDGVVGVQTLTLLHVIVRSFGSSGNGHNRCLVSGRWDGRSDGDRIVRSRQWTLQRRLERRQWLGWLVCLGGRYSRRGCSK